MPDIVAVFSAAVLASLFGWAALAKLVRRDRWRAALPAYGLGPIAGAAFVAVPAAEAAVVGLFLLAPMRAGAALALALLAGFSLGLARARALRGDRLPCGCFGRAATRSLATLLGRNAAMGGLAAIVLLSPAGRDRLLESFEMPARADLLPAALAVVGLGLGAWTAGHAAAALRRRESA